MIITGKWAFWWLANMVVPVVAAFALVAGLSLILHLLIGAMPLDLIPYVPLVVVFPTVLAVIIGLIVIHIRLGELLAHVERIEHYLRTQCDIVPAKDRPDLKW